MRSLGTDHRSTLAMSKYSEQVRHDAAKAADYIREHGWCQNNFADERGRCCAAGARNAVIYGSPCGVREYMSIEAKRESALTQAFKMESDLTMSIPEWNDIEGRTKEEVLAVFDRIANSEP